MSIRLKVASAAALLMSIVAAIAAADSTLAAGAAGTIETTGSAVAASGATPAAPPVTITPDAVSFAAPRPVVQAATAPDFADSLAALVASRQVPDSLDAEVHCLAGAVYFEAKSEPLDGQLAVARVVINRRDSGRFASSLCGVVYQPSQFSFVRGRSMPPINTASRDWQEAVAVAQIALDDAWDSPAEDALYFHARRVSPGWAKPRLVAIGNHVFYK